MFKNGAREDSRWSRRCKATSTLSKESAGSRERVDLALAREIGVGVARPGGFEPPTS